MTTDLGNGQTRAGDAVPRQRGGAHAAAKTSRFRRKTTASDSVPPTIAEPPVPSAAPVRAEPFAPVSAPLPPRPRTAQEPPPRLNRDPVTAPIQAVGDYPAANQLYRRQVSLQRLASHLA